MIRRAIASARAATYFFHPSGTCFSVKVGRVGFEAGEIADNALAAAEACVDRIPKKWKAVVASKYLGVYELPELAALAVAKYRAGNTSWKNMDAGVTGEAEEEEVETMAELTSGVPSPATQLV